MVTWWNMVLCSNNAIHFMICHLLFRLSCAWKLCIVTFVSLLLLYATVNDISVIYVTTLIYIIRCAGGLKKVESIIGLQCHRHLVGFFYVPIQAETKSHPFGFSDRGDPYTKIGFPTYNLKMIHCQNPIFVLPTKHSGTYESLCVASVCPCVCLSGSHTLLVVMHSYVSKATHSFLRMLPLF